MPTPRTAGTVLVIGLMAFIAAFAGCGSESGPTKAEQAAAKKAEDTALIALPYPRSSGTLPKSMEIVYDAANDRTTAMLRLPGLRGIGGGGALGASGATLHLTSSYAGRVRAPDNPEGSIDGALVVTVPAAGVVAYSGDPGTVTADGRPMPLKELGKGGYSSVQGAAGGGWEEVVRFRFPTPDLVTAANATSVGMTFSTVQLEFTAQQLADLREFAARLNPRP